MKLFYYSTDTLSFLNTRWLTVKYLLIGIVAGCIIFFSLFKFSNVSEHFFRTDAVNALEPENIILQQQLNAFLPQVTLLEMQAKHVKYRSDKLDKLLFRNNLLSDSLFNNTCEAKTFRIQSRLYAALIFKP